MYTIDVLTDLRVPGQLLHVSNVAPVLERGVTNTRRNVSDPRRVAGRGPTPLAAVTPRPRINLVLYYGVLGARSAWRARLAAPMSGRVDPPRPTRPAPEGATHRRHTNWLWAELRQRSFGVDVLACPRCGGRLELIALIEDPRVIRRILNHLGLPADGPAARPAPSPPLPIGHCDSRYDDEVAAP